jgi:hypothetical protein
MSSEITAAQKSALLKLPGFKDIQKQYAKEQKMEGGRQRRMYGRGFWQDVGNWFVKAGQNVNDFLKRTKLISNISGAVLPILAPMATALLTLNPLASAASVGASKAVAEGIKSLGYGSKMMMGKGNDPLAINPPNQRMRGINPKSKMRGAGYGTTNNTFGSNGMPQKVSAPAHSGMMGNIAGRGKGRVGKMMGMGGTEYGTVSSEFSNVQF